jgi:hypothetical protein
MEEMRKWKLILVRKPEGKVTGRFRHNWDDVIKIAFNKAGYVLITQQ